MANNIDQINKELQGLTNRMEELQRQYQNDKFVDKNTVIAEIQRMQGLIKQQEYLLKEGILQQNAVVKKPTNTKVNEETLRQINGEDIPKDYQPKPNKKTTSYSNEIYIPPKKIEPTNWIDRNKELRKVRDGILYNDEYNTIEETLTDGTTNSIQMGQTSKMFESIAGVEISVSKSPLEHANGIFSKKEIDSLKYNRFARHSVLDPYSHITTSHEILFFTKFDLHITKVAEDYKDGNVKGLKLIKELEGDAYFQRLIEEDKKDGNYKIIRSLQLSASEKGSGINRSSLNPFINLLTYYCKGGLSLPTVTANTVETPTNAYGTNYEYRGSGESNDDMISFSLEFNDNPDLDVYRFFKTYDKYETLKSHGAIPPIEKYVINRILYDQCGIYKFTLADDWSRILHYAYYWGAFPINVPREAFDQNIDNGLTYSVDFKAAFVDDMDPNILVDFNVLTKKWWNACKKAKREDKYGFQFYNDDNYPNGFIPGYDYMDNELVCCPHITTSEKDNNYYLIWR